MSWKKAFPLQTVFQGLRMIDLYLNKGLGVANCHDIKYEGKCDNLRKLFMQWYTIDLILYDLKIFKISVIKDII